MVKKLDLLYEGKAKKIFITEDENVVIQEFKDDATAGNGDKKGTIKDKGLMNTKISEIIFRMLESKGIPTHLIETISDTEQVVTKVHIFPIEVVIRNVVAGSMAKNLGLIEGRKLPFPILDLYLKDDVLGDPMITEYHIKALDLVSDSDMETIKDLTFKINDALKDFFEEIGIILVDFKLEFGKTNNGKIILADEISPDTCRFWDKETGEVLDKDRFRKDMGNIEGAYAEVLKRVSA